MFRTAILFFFITFFCVSAQAKSVKQVIQAQSANDQHARSSQKKVNKLATGTDRLVEKHRKTLKELESTRVYNNQLRQSIKAQRVEKLSIRKQIREVKYTDKKIIPLMVQMLGALEQFVQLDLPFLMKERMNRVSRLKANMSRADVTTSEKYRSILEAYQIENEYGRTVGTYQGLKNISGKKITVKYLRVGRLSYIYQTLDGKKQGYWSPQDKKWINIPSKFQKSISLGFKIASKQVTPNLILSFLPAPVRSSRKGLRN